MNKNEMIPTIKKIICAIAIITAVAMLYLSPLFFSQAESVILAVAAAPLLALADYLTR